MSESRFIACSGLLPPVDLYPGEMLEVIEPVVLYAVATGKPTLYAEPGDLCIVMSVNHGAAINGYWNEDAHIMFLDGRGSMAIDARNYKKCFRKLKDFPRTLDGTRKYQRGSFGMKRYKAKHE
jgi:hypothetical protein